jgi:hypothetical protein
MILSLDQLVKSDGEVIFGCRGELYLPKRDTGYYSVESPSNGRSDLSC